MRPDKKGAHRASYEKNKKKIFATQNVCAICGKMVDFSLKYPDPLSASIDHKIPVNGPGGIKGHPSDIDNLQLAHLTCNRQKSDKIFRGAEAMKPVVLGNRNLPQSMDWKSYRA